MEDGWTVIVSELNTVKNNAIIDSNEENCMSSNMCLWHLILYNALIYISLYYFADLFIRTLPMTIHVVHELQLNLHVWILKGSLFLQNLEKKVFIIKHTCNPGARSPKAQTSSLYTYG